MLEPEPEPFRTQVSGNSTIPTPVPRRTRPGRSSAEAKDLADARNLWSLLSIDGLEVG